VTVLQTLGWGPFFSSQLSEAERSTLLPGRVVEDRGRRLLARFEEGDRLVVVPGRLRDAGALPVVGDFLLAAPGDEPVVERILARRTALSRGAAGRAAAEQTLAANLDRLLVLQGLDVGVNARQLERTLAAAHACGVEPALVLTKLDLCGDAGEARGAAAAVAQGAPVVLASAVTGEGLEEVRALLPPGSTGLLLGPSGAGKSTLLNALAGERLQPTAEVRASDLRGRHTTVGRRLVRLPWGGLLVDGPGLRELKLPGAGGLAAAFEDVAALAGGCRFRDCRHAGEPGCAVEGAVRSGALDPARLESLQRLGREAAAFAVRHDAGAAQAERLRWRAVHREQRRFQRERGRK